MKTLNDYQILAMSTASYPDRGNNLIYPALKLAGEAGEAADKVGKTWRNEGLTSAAGYSEQQKTELVKELGDVLWYIAALADELNVSLEKVARTNIEKLQDRKARGVIKSEGDNR